MTKVFFFGDVGSGKTQLIAKLADPTHTFTDSSYIPTLDPQVRELYIDSRRFKLLDTPGQSSFESLSHIFLKNTDIAVYCIDLSQPLNKEKIDADLEKFHDSASKMVKVLPLVLVFTKADLEQQASRAEIRELLNSGKNVAAIRVSAQNNINISELSDILCKLAAVTKLSTPLTNNSIFEKSQQSKSNPKKDVGCEIPLWCYILCVPGWPVFILYHLINFLADTCVSSSESDEVLAFDEADVLMSI